MIGRRVIGPGMRLCVDPDAGHQTTRGPIADRDRRVGGGPGVIRKMQLQGTTLRYRRLCAIHPNAHLSSRASRGGARSVMDVGPVRGVVCSWTITASGAPCSELVRGEPWR